MIIANKKAFDLMADDIVELFTANELLKNELVDYDNDWLAKSKTNLSKQTDDEKRAILILPRMT